VWRQTFRSWFQIPAVEIIKNRLYKICKFY